MTDRRLTDSSLSPSSQSTPDARPVKANAIRRRSHPLLGVFPLAVMTLATFLVVFALMMARLQAGADPALRRGGANALVEPAAPGVSITTRASGGGTAVPIAASQASPVRSSLIVTRSSATTGGATHDD